MTPTRTNDGWLLCRECGEEADELNVYLQCEGCFDRSMMDAYDGSYKARLCEFEPRWKMVGAA